MLRARKRRKLRSNDLNEDGDDGIEIDELDPPPLINPIKKTDHWSAVYQTMKDSGWTWKSGNGLHDYIFMKPGINSIKGNILNVDYFTCEAHLKQYAVAKNDWEDHDGNPPEGSEDDEECR